MKHFKTIPLDRKSRVSVPKVVGNLVEKRPSMRRSVFPTDLHVRRCPFFRPTLIPELQAEAKRISGILMEAANEEIVAISELLASKPGYKLFGRPTSRFVIGARH
jgi:hypothetical protein